MLERDGKDIGNDSPKQARSCLFVRHSLTSQWHELVSSGRLVADVISSSSGVTFVLVLLRFRLFFFR